MLPEPALEWIHLFLRECLGKSHSCPAWSRCFTNLNSSCCRNDPVMYGLLLTPVYRLRNHGTERFSNLPKSHV